MIAEPRALLRKLNGRCTRALEAAVSACMSSRHYEVTVEHVLLALVDDRGSDVSAVFEHYRVELSHARGALQRYVGELRSGNAGKPVFSPLLLEWIEDAWLYASLELGEKHVRSGALLVRVVQSPTRYLPAELPLLERLPREEVRRELATLAAASEEAKADAHEESGRGGGSEGEGSGEAGGEVTSLGRPDGPLARFTTDLTERARAGKLDPIFGREPEIRQVVDILVRRRKNNPIIVGEAGVGKTALVEGLALRIAEGTVPEQLKAVHVLVLDLGALQAGSGVKGEFEHRLKGVIAEVNASPRPIVLFIDEAHTLIGAGGTAGTGGDAANLLKPALARGELRTIAATTWAEYKRYFEKDAALERRFQAVKVEEPSVESAIGMLRGLAPTLEAAHGVVVHDEAVRAAVTLSSRYITGRQLPDKAVDLLDTSAARAKVVRAAPPAALEDVQAELRAVRRELDAFAHDRQAGLAIDGAMEEAAQEKRAALEANEQELSARATEQRSLVERIDGLRKAVASGEESQRTELALALKALAAIDHEQVLVHADVDESLVASVVADWTGIPVGKMVADEIEAIVRIEERLRERVRGQDGALGAIAREIRAARAGLKPPTQPLGVFLLVGPSGVGKTETSLALGDLLFGGERFVVTINMSEFQERHTVSRLLGSPPGYVGFGEGGVLTEAVRQRPYSVVLLDEVEKADKEVLNVFYQVFDKGMLADGEGRIIDFKNTVVVMTSNLATDLLTAAAPPEGEVPTLEELTMLVKPVLNAHFKPALLARMTVVPYVPIRKDALRGIVQMKVGAAMRRARASHGAEVTVEEGVIDAIVARCSEVESGARNIDHILRGSVLPAVSSEILRQLADKEAASALRVVLDGQGNFAVEKA